MSCGSRPRFPRNDLGEQSCHRAPHGRGRRRAAERPRKCPPRQGARGHLVRYQAGARGRSHVPRGGRRREGRGQPKPPGRRASRERAQREDSRALSRYPARRAEDPRQLARARSGGRSRDLDHDAERRLVRAGRAATQERRRGTARRRAGPAQIRCDRARRHSALVLPRGRRRGGNEDAMARGVRQPARRRARDARRTQRLRGRASTRIPRSRGSRLSRSKRPTSRRS